MAEVEASKSLWPNIDSAGKTPVTHLREQAQCLKQETKDLVQGWVSPLELEWSGEDIETKKSVHHMFFLRVPVLDDYLYKLFSIRQEGDDNYPLIMGLDEDVAKNVAKTLKRKKLKVYGTTVIVDNEEQYLEALKAVFAADRTQELIMELMSDAQY